MSTGIAPAKDHELDPLEAEFRLDSVSAGSWITVIVCLPGLVYALTAGGAGDHALFLGDWLVALLSGVVSFWLPWRRIVRSRWREAAFLTWTLVDLLVIVVGVAADGGPSSPVTSLFFLPIIFVGTSYPKRSVYFVSALGLVSYVALAAVYEESPPRAVVVLGGLGAAALMSRWQAQSHQKRRRQLAEASITDPLTHVLNRRGLDSASSRELAAVARSGTPLGLVLLDLDEFKTYNDANGHIAGDALLAWTAETVRRTLRPTDSLARTGGDEFAILLPGADARLAATIGERIRAACEARVRLSVGVASAPLDGRDYDTLYRVADRALYSAKRGRARHRVTPLMLGKPAHSV